MSLRADHKALVFLGAVAVLGAGVRVSRAASRSTPSPPAQQALDRQMQSADSAADASAAVAARRSGRGRSAAGRRAARPRGGDLDSSRFAADSQQGTPSRRYPPGSLDRRGYVGKRLDLDVATAAQIDSLPGITPTMAKRIAADRIRRGPFLSLDGLRRVSGMGPTMVKRLDSLVTFSGVFTQGNPGDTTIAPRRKGRARRRGGAS